MIPLKVLKDLLGEKFGKDKDGLESKERKSKI